MRKINNIVIHCADTPSGKYFDSTDIREWHTTPKPKGKGWSDIGYHYVVLLDGTIEKGRLDSKIGAHVLGHNSTSIGICYIGGGDELDTRTVEQRESLIYLTGYLKRLYPKATVCGHRDFPNVTKTCPSFDAKFEFEII